jgi:hypothetical protein
MSTICKIKKLNGARLPDWVERLNKFVESNRNTPFTWGVFDCGRFCIKAEIAMYGVSRWDDIAADDKLSLRKAYRPIKENGCKSLWQLLDTRLERLATPLLAQRGDFVGHYVNDEESLGVCLGDKMVCISPTGLIFVDLSHAVTAWRV